VIGTITELPLIVTSLLDDATLCRICQRSAHHFCHSSDQLVAISSLM
jgi:hypothetical protein